MRKAMFAMLVLAITIGVVTPVASFSQERIEVAQQKKVTLWDMLFGPSEGKKKPSSGSTPSASLPPVVEAIEKSSKATRLMVFGDSLAVDLAKAMKRFYAEDPNLVIVGQGVGSSGFVRDDFFDWNGALADVIAKDAFDIGVVIMGINDRQNLSVDGKSAKPLTDEWKIAYSARLNAFLQQFRAAGKPVIWVGLPPMAAPKYSAAMTQISSLQRLAAFSGGAEFVDIYERFTGEDGGFSQTGPDLNGQTLVMRKGDGIHFSSAGSDKLVFYINQSLKLFYRAGTISISVVDPLEGTDAQNLLRLPLQGLGQIRLLEVAGAIIPLSANSPRAGELFLSNEVSALPSGFEMTQLVTAPVGRVDAFGVGVEPGSKPGTNSGLD